MTVQSTYNVVIPLPGKDYFVLFNTLAGSMEVLDETAVKALRKIPGGLGGPVEITGRSNGNGNGVHLDSQVIDYLDRRGYLFESFEEERTQSRMLYEEMLKWHRQAVRQPLVVIPSYKCDLGCPYCWQRLYHMDSPVMSEETAEVLFERLPEIVDLTNPNPIDLVVFGGEPLQDTADLRERVLHLLRLGRQAGFSTKIITNGVGLGPAVPYLAGNVDLLQVTIDGPAVVHKKRRPLPVKRDQTGRGDSFTPMVEGITKALAAGLRINVRVNTDTTNLPYLPELADFAREQGWLDSGLLNFHIAPVKNHNPRKETNSEDDLLNAVLELVANDSRMSIFDLKGFPGLKYFDGFKETGLFSLHRFFNCEAQINFFAFDLYGDIYSCWDAAGLKHLAVGTFKPRVQIFEEKLNQWRARTSLDIQGCDGCVSQPHCGGGCQFLALEHAKTFQASSCDSMLEGYKQSILSHGDWLIERAHAGDHAVGLLTANELIHEVTGEFGLVDRGGIGELPVGCA